MNVFHYQYNIWVIQTMENFQEFSFKNVLMPGINCNNFDHFRAAYGYIRGHNPSYTLYVSPPFAVLRLVSPFSFTE